MGRGSGGLRGGGGGGHGRGAEEVRRVKMGFRVVEVRGEGQDGKAGRPGAAGEAWWRQAVNVKHWSPAGTRGWPACPCPSGGVGLVGYLRFTSVFFY